MLQTSVICNFKSRFTGRIILPSDRAYESARRVHNGAILRHPALMAVCATIDEVCDGKYPLDGSTAFCYILFHEQSLSKQPSTLRLVG